MYSKEKLTFMKKLYIESLVVIGVRGNIPLVPPKSATSYAGIVEKRHELFERIAILFKRHPNLLELSRKCNEIHVVVKPLKELVEFLKGHNPTRLFLPKGSHKFFNGGDTGVVFYYGNPGLNNDLVLNPSIVDDIVAEFFPQYRGEESAIDSVRADKRGDAVGC